MSWYEPYKPYVDLFLSGWIWLLFIVRVYFRLPDIISGVGSGLPLVQDTVESGDYIRWSMSGGKGRGRD